MRAILTLPRFLYLTESDPGNGPGTLDAYELASRLSYFLWSSMPDEQLRKAASSGKILEHAELRPKSREC